MKSVGGTCAALFVAVLLVNAKALESEQSAGKTDRGQVVVFVCEHGVAKSVIAAAHFNRLPGERNLSVRAVARGTNPMQAIPAGVLAGLRADGLEPAEKPTQLSEKDVDGREKVVAFCKLPEKYYSMTSVDEWNDVPPVTEDYGKA